MWATFLCILQLGKPTGLSSCQHPPQYLSETLVSFIILRPGYFLCCCFDHIFPLLFLFFTMGLSRYPMEWKYHSLTSFVFHLRCHFHLFLFLLTTWIILHWHSSSNPLTQFNSIFSLLLAGKFEVFNKSQISISWIVYQIDASTVFMTFLLNVIMAVVAL